MKTKLIAAALLMFAAPAFADTLITGAGSTFVYPIASKWFSDYNKLHPAEKFNYQSIGSGGGVKQITEKTVDFGASDAPMTDAELAKAGAPIVQLPVTLGAVVVAFNVPGVTALNLSPKTLGGIFLGTITKWNDPAIAAENAGVKLPDMAIAVAHRSDGSGTTAIFTDYLAKVSPEWKAKVGAGKSVKWPVGLGGKGNEGVTGLVKQAPGGIGYVELAYANQNKLAMAAIQNQEGAFVKPSIESTSAAGAGVQMPNDFRVSITNPAGKASYPISGFTWILVYKDQTDATKGPAIVKFLWWAIHDGQKVAPALDYAPLPEPVVKKVEAALKTITVQGKPALASNP
ncbi:MAG: phosphate ABC transporter substrate-binding protein PstS [Deltaproteobacteria bacterium]|nr:phosphate ABC transporter substrate-binding protein PstS [Deltaproteobacteria bacterium]